MMQRWRITTILKWWEIKESPTVEWWLITVVTAAGLRFRYTIEQTIIQALKTQNEIKWGLYTGVLAFGESTVRLFFPFISNKLNNKLMTTFISSAFSLCLKCYLTEQHQSHWCLAEESPSPKFILWRKNEISRTLKLHRLSENVLPAW